MVQSGFDQRYVYLISSITAIAGLLFGFDIAVINGALVYLREAFHLSDRQTEIAASSLIFGCIFGTAVTGTLTDRYGRRPLLAFAALLFGLSSLGAGLAPTFALFQVARFLGGLAIGVGSMLAPLYIAEASPADLRGRLVSLNQMAIVTGILLAYLVNWMFSFRGPDAWRWMFASALLPSAMLFAGMFVVPESPRWLVERGREEEARTILNRVEGTNAERQMDAIRVAVSQERSTFADLFAPALRKPLFFVTALAVLSQITGMNTVLFYGTLIWEQHVGSSSHSAAIGANLTIGLVNFLGTILALWLIERSGRRPLLLVSSACMGVCQLGLGLSFLMHPAPAWLALGCMLMTVASFAIGLGPITWVLMAEVLPTRVRGRAMSFATVALWMASFAMTSTFLTLSRVFGITGVFAVYSGLCLVTVALGWWMAPETKGRSLEEIEASWT